MGGANKGRHAARGLVAALRQRMLTAAKAAQSQARAARAR